MELITILIIGIVIVALIGITGIIIGFIALGKSNQSSEITQLKKDFDEFTTSVEKVIVSQAQSLNTGTRGLQGPRGPSGPQGPPGMDYSAAGQLLNMATKTVATPTAGQGEQSIVYLDNKNYAPFQFWFLENTPTKNGVRVKNKLTNFCLKTDDKNNVFSMPCSKDFGDSNELFNWNQNMQLKSIGQPEQCMTMQQNFIRGAGVSNQSLDPLTTKPLPKSNQGNVNRIALETCSSSINPNQTWFVGS
jgi:hypothetical protein